MPDFVEKIKLDILDWQNLCLLLWKYNTIFCLEMQGQDLFFPGMTYPPSHALICHGKWKSRLLWITCHLNETFRPIFS